MSESQDSQGGSTYNVNIRDSSGIAIGPNARVYTGNADRLNRPMDIPPPPPHFKDREKELEKLLHDLQPGQVVTLWGPGGIGKSALAAHAVWQMTNQGKNPPEQFPDGVIFHSFYNQPSADIALEHIARVYGEEPKPTPKLAAQQALSGRRTLILLDGAEAADDLAAVLEVRGACGVLVTSRDRGDIVVMGQDMSPLPIDDAADLLMAWSGNGVDSEIVRRVCELVGRLPLAVRLAGRYLASTLGNPANYLTWLESSPLVALDQGKLREQSVPLLLERSMEQVGANAVAAMAVIGLLALAPFELEAMMAALKWNEIRVERALGELVRFGLLGKINGAYQVSHALVHTYANKQVLADDECLARLAEYYRAQLEAVDIQEAAGRYRAETLRPQVMHLLEQLVRQKQWHEISDLVWAIHGYLGLSGHWLERIQVCLAGLDAGRAMGKRFTEGAWLGNLGIAYSALGQVERAIEYYLQALEIAREIGDRRGEGSRLSSLGNAYRSLGQMERAVEHLEKALAIAREIGDRLGEGNRLGNLGATYTILGQVERAFEQYEQALAIAREIGDQRGEGKRLSSLGDAYRFQGQVERAIEYYQQALEIAREIGDRRGEGNRLGNFGSAYFDLGQVEHAIEYYQQALAIAREIGDRRNESIWLSNLGLAYRDLGQVEQAKDLCQQALTISREIGNRQREGQSLNNLGGVYYSQGQLERAAEHYQQALTIAREIRHRSGEGETLNNLGMICRDQGNSDLARQYFRQALDIFIEIKSPKADKTRKSLNEYPPMPLPI